MNNGIDMSEVDALLELSQSNSDADLTYQDPLLSQLTEEELSADEKPNEQETPSEQKTSSVRTKPKDSACGKCPLAMWIFRSPRQGLSRLTAYCSAMHKNTYGGDNRDETGVVSRCGKQLQALEAWKTAKEKDRKERGQVAA